PAGRRPSRSALVAAGFVAVVAVIIVTALVTGGSNDHAAPAATAPSTAASTAVTVTTVAGAQAAIAGAAPSSTITLNVTAGSLVTGAGAAPTPPSAGGAALAPLYLPALPQQYQVMTAEQTYPFGTLVAPAIIRQLWTNGTPSATSPRWLQISAGDTTLGAAVGGVRVATVHGVAVITHNDFGGLTGSGEIAGTTVTATATMTVTAAGLSLTELIGVIDGAVLDNGELTFHDGAMPADLHMIASDAPADPATRPVATSISTMTVSYQSSQDATAKLFVSDMAGESALDKLWDEYTVPVHDRIDLGGSRVADVRSTTGTDGAWSYIDVTVDGASLRLSGTTPLADALIGARTLQRVGDERWTSLKAVAALNQQAYPPVRYTDFRQLEGGADGDAARWSVLSARGADNAPDAYQVRLGASSASFSQQDSPAVHVVSDRDVTLVIGVAPRGHDGAFLHVVLGGASYTVPLQPQADDGTNLVGIFAFSNVIVPTIELVDLGGEVLLSGPPVAH
ncbi:MAG: hypothetical protein ABIR68_10225, partial [Ilumatobacteraceae bacterium]